MALAALKKKTKKKVIARRKTVGAKAAPMDNYKKCSDFFHFNSRRSKSRRCEKT